MYTPHWGRLQFSFARNSIINSTLRAVRRYGAAKQLLSALHRRRTALYGADFAALIAPVSISLFDAALRGVYGVHCECPLNDFELILTLLSEINERIFFWSHA